MSDLLRRCRCLGRLAQVCFCAKSCRPRCPIGRNGIRPIEPSKGQGLLRPLHVGLQPSAYAPARLPRRRLDRIRPRCINRDPAHRERDRQRSRTKQRHDPERARAERAESGPDTSVMMAVIVPTATPPYIPCAVAARAGGTTTDSICMQARCNRANVRPCNGSTSAIAGSQAVTAVTLQRTIPRWPPARPRRPAQATSAASDPPRRKRQPRPGPPRPQ